MEFNKIPSPEILKVRSIALAVLDAIICQEWEYRYFSYNSRWDVDSQMASMRDGEGSEYFILFLDDEAAIKGLVNGKERIGSVTLKKLATQMPARLVSKFIMEPAFSVSDSTFIFWMCESKPYWQSPLSTKRNDGASALMQWLLSDARFYKKWAEDYYEIDVDVSVVEKVFGHERLMMSDVLRLNDDVDVDLLRNDLQEINYPGGLELI